MSDQGLPPIDPQPRATRSPVWVRAVLFVSLAANLLVVGVVVGALVLRGGPGPDGSPRLRDAGLGPLGLILDASERDALRGELKRHSGDLRDNRERMRQDFARLLATLRAEPFDQAAFAAVLDEQRATVAARQHIGHQALIRAVSAATPSERMAMADRIERALRRGGRR